MRSSTICVVIGALGLHVISGCASQRCLEEYSTMPVERVIRRDGELLRDLVAKRQAAAETLREAGDQSSQHGDLVLSIQAWEMAIRLVAQLQNLSRREEHANALTEHRELVSNIRCLARSWADQGGHIIGTRDGQRMLQYQRDLETDFGERGRPTDSQLTDIIEGREIYMGPVEEEIDVPEEDDGTGPQDASPAGGGEEETEGAEEEAGDGDDTGDGDEGESGDSTSAIDELLGE
jgi:hypothetical protein